MIGYIRRVISATVAPHARLRLNRQLFARVVGEIHRRGEEKRESGAFLLGTIASDGIRTVNDVVYYEDLDPNCTRGGAIALGPQAFAQVWSIASERQRQVVADVHSHPGRAIQSSVDRAHPAVALAGHVALIVPDFGRRGAMRPGLGVFEYLGSHNWRVVDESEQKRYVELGWWV